MLKYIRLENSTNLAQQTELQLVVVITLRRHTKTLSSFFSLNSAIDQYLREFCRSLPRDAMHPRY